MEELISSIKSIKSLYKKNDINSIDSFLDLPLRSIKQSSAFMLRHSISSIREKIATAYLARINPLSVEESFLHFYNKNKSDVSDSLFSFTEKAHFKNYLSNIRDTKKFINLVVGKLKEEQIDTKEIELQYANHFAYFNDLENVINELNHINDKTISFFAMYKEFENTNTIIEDYKKFIGESFDLISDINKISPYTAFNAAPDDSYDKFEEINNKVLDLLANKNESKYGFLSEYYKKYRNQNTIISDFLFNANIDSNKVTESIFPESSKINKFILFKDNTSIIEYKNGKINTYDYQQTQHLESVLEVEIELIQNLLYKKPNMAKFFILKHKEEGDISEIIICIESFLKNEQILKNSKVNIMDFAQKSIENIYDTILKIERNYKIDQLCKSIMSNKYKDLFDKNTRDIIAELYDKGVSTTKLQEFAGRKLALFKSSKEFNTFLDTILDQMSDFSIDSINSKLDLMNIKPVINENNIIVFEVKTFAQSQTLGSKSWCISREDYYFDDYTSNNSKQYFLYDFNKKELDLDSMIGFTLYEDGKFRSQHLKNDDYISVNEFLKSLSFKIFDKKANEFRLCKEISEEYDQYKNNIKIKETNKLVQNGY